MIKKLFAGALFFVLLTLLVVLSHYRGQVLPKKGEIRLKGLQHPINTYQDEFGIPHIEGKSLEDIYVTLGYLTASERLFQMDLYRRLVQGRLSEVFGPAALESDILLRTLRFKKMGERLFESLPKGSDMYRYAEAYLRGVHAFIDEGNLPIEFLLKGYKPERFEISDMIGMTGYMALTFTEGLNGDVLLSELQERLPEAKINTLRVGADTDIHYFKDQKVVKAEFLEQINRSLEFIGGVLPLFEGSNSWILAGARTQSGYPILANDPHIGMSNPHIFYEAHIKSPNFELYGNYIPLIPFPVMGHTPYSAWGLTMSEVDDFNVYLEKINPDDPSQVMHKNEWVDLVIEEEEIKVYGEDSHFIQVKQSPHGPFIDGTKNGVKGKNLSISWSVYHPENNVMASLYQLPRAQSPEEFRLAVQQAAAPGLNISWVHKNGDIAWWMMGKYPKLPDGVSTDMVLNGWDGSHEIERYYTIDENPHSINPDSGLIITANYKPQLQEFQHFDGYWQPGGRYFRIEKLLSQKEKWSLEEFKQIQFDNKVPIFDQLKGQLLSMVKREGLSEWETEALETLNAWDGECDTASIGCSIYHMWNYFNVFHAYVDEMGKSGFKKWGKTADFWHSYKYLMFHPDNSLWDNVKTGRVESGQDIVTKSFKKALSELENRYGHNQRRWRWGRLHKAEYKHPFGRQKPLHLLFNIGPVESFGGRYVINNIGHAKATSDFSAVHAPATRRLIDLGNVKSSWGISPTGNSGNPFSPHYSDQTTLYHAGKYRKQEMNWETIKRLPVLKFIPISK